LSSTEKEILNRMLTPDRQQRCQFEYQNVIVNCVRAMA
jgi:hypothetical protein